MSHRILIVDDNGKNIQLLGNLLMEAGYTVEYAFNGQLALQWLQRADFDAILLDIMMPEMDGYETIQEIRKMPQFRRLPIIAVTAKSMIGDRDKCIQAGASDYITKPVDVDQLLSLLRVWLYES